MSSQRASPRCTPYRAYRRAMARSVARPGPGYRPRFSCRTRNRASALLLRVELRELRIVDLDVSLAAQFRDVFAEALVVEVFPDALLQVFAHVREGPVTRGLAVGDPEKMDRAGLEGRRRVLLRRSAEDRCIERRKELSFRDRPQVSAAVPRIALRVFLGQLGKGSSRRELRARLLQPRHGSLARRRVVGRETDDDRRNARRFGDSVQLLLLPLVFEPQHVLGDLELGGHVAADDLLQ